MKVFEQCSGFLRISRLQQKSAETSAAKKPAKSPAATKKPAKSVKSGANPLDATNIHPESYRVAGELVTLAGAELDDIGSTRFRETITGFVGKQDLDQLANRFKYFEI